MRRGFTLRAARPRDAAAMARILAHWIDETPWFMSRAPYSASRAAMAEHLCRARVVVAQRRGLWRRVLGFAVRDGNVLAALYVARDARQQGIGRALLAELAGGGDDLHLTLFAANTPARSFYRAMGCIERGQTVGANEEGLPDLRLVLRAQQERTAHG
ncbi:MAG: GNAT family N-acetyltransferase [Paracoccaceae bacterium]